MLLPWSSALHAQQLALTERRASGLSKAGLVQPSTSAAFTRAAAGPRVSYPAPPPSRALAVGRYACTLGSPDVGSWTSTWACGLCGRGPYQLRPPRPSPRPLHPSVCLPCSSLCLCLPRPGLCPLPCQHSEQRRWRLWVLQASSVVSVHARWGGPRCLFPIFSKKT